MNRPTLAIGFVAAAAFFASLAVQAQDAGDMHRHDPPAAGSGRDDMTGHARQMSQMMDHCRQMMQGASARPNDQWRDDNPPAAATNGKKQ